MELSVLMHGGLPVRAYTGVDIQSDVDAAKKLCPGFLTGNTFEDGALIAMVIQCLISLCWTGSNKQSFSDHNLPYMSVLCAAFER